MKMKRFATAVLLAALTVIGCEDAIKQMQFSVAPRLLEFDSKGGTQTVEVVATTGWTLSVPEGAGWCTPAATSGTGSAKVSITAGENTSEERVAELIFESTGNTSVKVTVRQAAGTSGPEGSGSGDLYPDPASGITVEPAYPDADQPCTIIFKPKSGNPLYGHSGELYCHLGVVVDGEWMYVPSEWGTTDEKVHLKKKGSNSWELELKPSIREYFKSGTTPVTTIAIIVRSADGEIKSHDQDQFCSVQDNRYAAEVFVPDPVVKETMPSDVKHGINYNADNSVTFVFYDKDTDGKAHEYCYIVGDWNNWERISEGAMKYDEAAGCWWIALSGFDADKEYRFQYRLGTESGSDIRVSDPYTEIVYDQSEDQYIDWAPDFPAGAKGLVSAFQINRPAYQWKHSDFKVEDKHDLVIYEMLFRDFTKSHDIEGAMAQLDYIENLGVNAVQLMPVQEFDGNISWGYNPNHWFALDKYYGTREEYKDFIDECHSRGLAVIIDVVYNHATGAHPWAKMWWSGSATASNNPFFNVTPAHPYNVYHDMNHENALVKEHVKRSLEYLLTEYDVDGFRFDLTKGFTQKQTDPDVSAWGRKDESRINILKGYADHIWSVDEDAIVIFEHLSDWDEEEILANHGIQLWRNVNSQYHAAVSGGSGDFTNMYSTKPFGGYVGYMESHDEERICYGDVAVDAGSITWGVIGIGDDWNNDKIMSYDAPFFVVKNVEAADKDRFKIRKAGVWDNNYNYGASSENYKLALGQGYQMKNGADSKDMYVPAQGVYDIYFSPDMEMVWLMNQGERPDDSGIEVPDTEDSEDPHVLEMRRAGAGAAFFLTVPGPKMIWQFGEIGYDYSIDYNDRTGEKPVVTDEYMADPERKKLYDTYSALLKFRRENPRFFDKDAKFEWTPAAKVKSITCSADGKTFHVVGNFGKSKAEAALPDGQWKDYMDGNAAVSGTVVLKPGEFKLLTNF